MKDRISTLFSGRVRAAVIALAFAVVFFGGLPGTGSAAQAQTSRISGRLSVSNGSNSSVRLQYYSNGYWRTLSNSIPAYNGYYSVNVTSGYHWRVEGWTYFPPAIVYPGGPSGVWYRGVSTSVWAVAGQYYTRNITMYKR